MSLLTSFAIAVVSFAKLELVGLIPCIAFLVLGYALKWLGRFFDPSFMYDYEEDY